MTIWGKYCIGKGMEIGGGLNNPFNLNTINVSNDSKFHKENQIKVCGQAMKVDIVADAHSIPVPDESYDFIINSHVLEHLDDPIKALIEWTRIIKPDGIIFMIIPHKDRTFDSERERTTLNHLIEDFKTQNYEKCDGHQHVWITKDVVELVNYMINEMKMPWTLEETEDTDSKVGNGFTIVIRKDK